MDKEIWKDIEGYEGYYKVSNFGRVKSLDRNTKKGKIRALCKATCGHLHVGLYKDGIVKMHYVHRLVASAFLPPVRVEVNHINGIKTDNRVENLEWCTHSENIRHSFNTGLEKVYAGEHNHNAKLNAKQVDSIRKEYIFGSVEEGITGLAKKYNVGRSTIHKIVKGKTYKNQLF